jgi:hypothetical protein
MQVRSHTVPWSVSDVLKEAAAFILHTKDNKRRTVGARLSGYTYGTYNSDDHIRNHL